MSSNNHIQKVLEEINHLVDEYKQSPSLILLDLLQEKTRSFYEQIQALKSKSNSGIPEPVIKQIELEPKDQTVTEAKEELIIDSSIIEGETEVVEFLEELTPKLNPIEKESEIDSNNSEIKEVLTKENKINDKVTKAVIEPTIANEFNTPKETVADQYNAETSMNDLLAKIRKDTDLATQLQNTPIKDFKNAISLNERVWFESELFNHDLNLYKQTIEKINQAKSINEAIKIIDPFNWDKEQDSTKQFVKLIYRKFV